MFDHLLGKLLSITLAAAIAATGAAVRADEADDQFAVAAGHYSQQRWAMAVDEFRRFLEAYPDHAMAAQSAFLLGEALLQTGRFTEAGPYFRQYLRAEPDGKFAREALFRAGEAAHLDQKPAQAKTELEQFQTKYPDDKLNAYVFTYLGAIDLGANDAAAASQRFRECLRRFPEGPLSDDCRFGLARALERLNQNAEAEKLYRQVAAAEANALADDANFHLGALQYATGQYAEAIKSFETFETDLADSPWQTKARLGRGWAMLKLERFKEAVPVFESIAEEPTVAVEALYWLGLTYKALEDWDNSARTLLKALAAAGPDHPLTDTIRFQAGNALLETGDPQEALKQFDEILSSPQADNPWVDEALRGKVQAALEMQDYEAVDRHAAEFLRRFPASPMKPDIDRMLARASLEQKQCQKAVDLLEPLVTAGKTDKQALEDRYLLAWAYEGLKRYDDALAVLLTVVDTATGQLKADAQLAEGSILLAMKRYADAVAPLEAFLASKPTGDAAVKGLGELVICYARNKQLDKAKAGYEELSKRYVGHTLIGPTTEQLAEAAYAAGDTAWATQLFERMADANGSNDEQVRGLAGLGWSQFKAGKLAEAERTFAQLLKKNPPKEIAVEAALVRGRVLEKLGQTDPALAMYDLVIDNYADTPQHPQALLAAASIRDVLQQDEEAALLYERLAKDYPELKELDLVLYQWSWVMHDLGKLDESNKLLQRLRTELPKSRFWADATYRLAQRAHAAGDLERAEQLCSEVLAGNAPASVREHTLSLSGQIAAARQDWKQVRQRFEQLLDEFPETPLRLPAEFWIAETIYRQGDYPTAAARFERLRQQLPGKRQAWMAMIPLRQAQMLVRQEKMHEAYAIASKIAAEYPGFEQQYEVDFVLGRCLASRADFEGARQAYQRVIASPEGAKTETAAMAQWYSAETFLHQKNHEEALRQFHRVELLYAYPKWQALALLEAGKCREALGEAEKATELYRQILKLYPNTEGAERAAQRLRTLPASSSSTAGEIDSSSSIPAHEEENGA